MALVRTRRIIDDAGADAVHRRRRGSSPNAGGHRVVIAVVDPHGELIELRRTRGRADRLLARGGRQGSHRGDLRAAEPRDRGAGHERPPRRAGAARRLRLTGGIPLRVDGEVVGAIGTSGETPDEDEAVSIAGAAATPYRGPALTYEGARLAAEAAAAAQRGVAP